MKIKKMFHDFSQTEFDRAIDLITEFEGFSSKPYLCPAGVLTIGYGHTAGVKDGQRITEEGARQLLVSDLLKFQEEIAPHIKVPVSLGQFSALMSFAYNLGVPALAGSTLLKKLNGGKEKEASEEFSRWVKAKVLKKQPNGTFKPTYIVLGGLVRRRDAERTVFESED